MIHEPTSKVSLHSFVDIGDLRDDRLDTRLAHGFIRPGAHSTRQQNLAVCDGGCHTGVPRLSGRVKTMPAGVFALCVWLTGKMGVSHLVRFSRETMALFSTVTTI
jgi:hypothetical protein